MFNIKSIVKQITERSKDSNAESPSKDASNTFLQKTEGFLCPKCMKKLPSPWELQYHYESVHDEVAAETDPSVPAVPIVTSGPEEENDRSSPDQDLFVCGDVAGSSLSVEDVPLLTDVTVLQERLQQALNRKATLESRVVRLVQSNATLKAAIDDTNREFCQLQERHKILEAQLAHRESIDDAAVLRQELVQVQRVMDEMNREREKERDELQAKLLELQENDSDPLIEILKSSLAIKEEECKKLADELDELKLKHRKFKEENAGASVFEKTPKPNTDCRQDNTESETDALELEPKQEISTGLETELQSSVPVTDVNKQNDKGNCNLALTDLTESHNQLKSDLMKKEEELTRTLREIEISKQTIAAQNKMIETMKLKQHELHEMYNQEKRARTELTGEIKNLSEEKTRIESEFYNSVMESSLAQRTLSDLQQSLFELQHEYQNEQLEHKQKLEQLGVLMKEKCKLLEKQEDAVQILVTERADLIRRLELIETEKLRDKKESSQMLEKLQSELAQNVTAQKQLQECMLSETKKSHSLQEQLNKLTESSGSTLQKKSEEIKALSAALDDITGEKLALEAKLEASGIEQQKLLERCYTSTGEIETLQHTVAEVRRKWEESESALQDLGRENATLQLDIEKLLARKWTEDGDVTQCTLCLREFTMLLRKHHCRNCGQIFCNECSSKTAAVVSNKKPVRVCDSCYNELRAQ